MKRYVTKATATIAGIVLVTAGLYWWCTSRVLTQPPKAEVELKPRFQAAAQVASLPVWYEAVGTIKPILSTRIGSQVSAQVKAVAVDVGDSVAKDLVLVEFDSQVAQARLEQTKSTLESVKAQQVKAKASHTRTRQLLEEGAATLRQMEQVEAEYQQAKAAVKGAIQQVREAGVFLQYHTVRSPIAGVISNRDIDPGDLAWPGRFLLEMYDPRALRLEASVREGIIHQITEGSAVQVTVSALQRSFDGRVDEIVPLADPRSRSFKVRVSLPEESGLYPGMFATLQVKLGSRQAIVIPSEMIEVVGQLETVLVLSNKIWSKRYVTTGHRYAEGVEVLSGLSEGEIVGRLEGK